MGNAANARPSDDVCACVFFLADHRRTFLHLLHSNFCSFSIFSQNLHICRRPISSAFQASFPVNNHERAHSSELFFCETNNGWVERTKPPSRCLHSPLFLPAAKQNPTPGSQIETLEKRSSYNNKHKTMTIRTLRILGDRSCRKRVQVIGSSSASLSFRKQRGWTKSCGRGFGTTTATTNVNDVDRHTTANRASDRLLVVGSGVAGSAAALVAAETHRIPVTILFAGNVPQDCNSWWAQGGIIYRNYDPSSGDSAKSLAEDIHRAGAGLCASDAVDKVSHEGPDRVKEMLLKTKAAFADVPFDRTPDGELSLCLGECF